VFFNFPCVFAIAAFATRPNIKPPEQGENHNQSGNQNRQKIHAKHVSKNASKYRANNRAQRARLIDFFRMADRAFKGWWEWFVFRIPIFHQVKSLLELRFGNVYLNAAVGGANSIPHHGCFIQDKNIHAIRFEKKLKFVGFAL